MSVPYLQRRGETYCFRIAVPSDLRTAIGAREITRSLKTPDRRIATPRALHLASQALILFAELRAMPKKSDDGIQVDFSLMLDMNQFGRKVAVARDIQPGEEVSAALAVATLQAHADSGDLPASLPQPVASDKAASSSPLLSTVIEDFIRDYPADKPDMLKKHNVTLPFFLEIVGDKPIARLRQSDIKSFFVTINALPPYAKEKCKKLGISLRELAKLEHPKVIAAKTFRDHHKTCMQNFLESSRDELHDQGFPPNLHANYDYQGKDEPRKTQRALTTNELKRLFEGGELKRIASRPDEVHKFWLPVLGLYTGARVNEICQINPQTDFLTDAETGIPYILLSEDTEAGEGIEKSIKTEKARKVPLHPQLIELGFPDYVTTIKKAGAKRLFPAWTPRGGRAAPNAIGWFSKFLQEIGLYGVENEEGCVLLGMHAFRHTLLTYGENQKPSIDLSCISGHIISQHGKNSRDGYIDPTIVYNLSEKRDRLAALNYGLTIPKPAPPR